MIDMSGRGVLVTGGTKGIGRGIAKRFLEAGAKVVVCARKPADVPLEGAAFVAADLREADAAEKVVAFAKETMGRLDVLINNAGGAPPADSATVSPRFTASILALNLTAPLLLSQRAYAVMKEQPEGGSIVNIASVSGTRPSPLTVAYGAAKAGLLNATETLAVEWGPKVRVNAIIAGMVKTEQAHLFYGDEAGIARVSATVPLGRLAEPEDIADVCLFLASPLARYVTGAHLAVHGGGERPAYLDAAKR
jgi:NAD(P)-dependent dehydrogenase (short-subunit alcohol dehydrogenase family)